MLYLRASRWIIGLLMWVATLAVTSAAERGAIAEQPQAAAETGTPPPGVVVNYSPAATGQYLGSPSIAVLTNGDYVVSHDYFGTSSTLQLSSVFSSADRGLTWRKLCDIDGQWWSGLFVRDGVLYLMGNRKWLGDVIIRRSDDGGNTWSEPNSATTGLLMAGRYHTSAVPVVEHAGRLWRTMESNTFQAFMMSVPVDTDLMNAANWSRTNLLPSPAGYNNWREGNAVVTPEGGLINLIRVHVAEDKASILRLSPDGTTLSYDAAQDLIDFPGGAAKFTIRYDPQTKRYWTLANKEKNPSANRNILALTSSADLRNWKVEATVLQHPSRSDHAFQYADWLFEGDDIIAVVRTAWDGAANAHDSNYITFHRFKGFRTLGKTGATMSPE